MRTPLRVLGPLLLLVVALGGCSNTDAEGAPNPDFRPQKETPSTLRSGAVDPYAVPDVIDKAYIEKVISAIDVERNKTTDKVILEDRFDPIDEQRLRALYGGDALDWQLSHWRDAVYVEHPEKDGRTSIPALGMAVTAIHEASQDCVWVNTLFTPSGLPDRPPFEVGQVLQRRSSIDRSFNPTGWVLTQDGLMEQITKANACG